MTKGIKKNQQVIIFDDGLQDKTISYDLEFVCFDAENFIGNGCLIPAGPLREKLESLNKYDAVFLKNNNSNIIDQKNLLKKYNKNIKIFDTYYEITNLNKFNLDNEFLIFSGIGNPLSFKKILINNKFKVVKEIIFPDHYDYKKKEIENIILVAKKNNYKIITTEKDLMKINNFDLKEVNFIEISLRIKNEKELIDFLRHKFYE